MNLLFIYGGLGLGGVETLIVKLSNWLSASGDKVTLLLGGSNELERLLSEKVKVHHFGDIQRLFYRGRLARITPGLCQNDFDAVVSFDPLSLWMSAFAVRYLRGEPAFLTGVYHPRIYFFEKPIPYITRLARIVFDRYVEDSSKYFMNEPVRDGNEKAFGRPFPKSSIIPVPVDVDRFTRMPRCPVHGRIVSVGRLVAFKNYNLYMIDLVGRLLERGHRVEWHVYGDGELESLMMERILERGLEKHVFLHGSLAYSDLETAFETAHCFVGQGTALLEAGAAGVPGVPAIACEDATSYGLLPELPYFTVGERLPDMPMIEVQELLERLLTMDEEEYEAECRRTQHYCRGYSIDIVGAMFRDVLLGSVGTCLTLRGMPNRWRVLFKMAWYSRIFRGWTEIIVFSLAKKLVPARKHALLRLARRRKFARASLAAEGINQGVSREKSGMTGHPRR